MEVTESQDFDGLLINGQKRSIEEFQKLLELRKMVGAKSSVRGLAVQSAIPIGAGLGSSGALCTALAKLHTDADPERVARAAWEGEKLFHGRPSGVDPFTIAAGCPIVYRASDQNWRPLALEKFRRAELCFVLKDTGLRHSTVQVIQAVSRVREQTPLIWEDLMDALATNAEGMVRAFEENPGVELGRLMNDSHFRLIQLGVSCDELDSTVEELRNAGALGAKLTGAGRGGFVLSLFRKDAAAELAQQPGCLVHAL